MLNSRTLERDGWEYAGFVGVDSGLMWVGDPAFIRGDQERAEHPIADWDAFLESMETAGLMDNGYARAGKAGVMGMVTAGFGGDGTYPVYVLKDEDYVRAVVVLFRPDREGDPGGSGEASGPGEPGEPAR